MSKRLRTSYEKRVTSKVIRTEHVIGIWFSQSVAMLREALENVPATAILVEIEDSENGDEYLLFRDEEIINSN
jgi:hypothetical protein